ncbi:LysR family transcriptional regulator [Abyssogena phaseoliformis symbiont]|uniref:LysR family transcriptional regulator n=1 Tax=Abyssogena phaseoliformis symbiont TaxID=596095 RepID=UPI001916C86D|nr:LysR family transcriptional regulator [Abyssogena phaseoliformis symbiont]
MVKAVEMDKGISTLPSYICVDAIKEEKLEIINLPKSTNITNDIWIAYRKEDLKNKSIALLIKTLVSNT